MNGMTTQERYNDICRISGMSEDIVRRVLNAEKQSIINSLKRGERATLIGRCVIRPELSSKIAIGGGLARYVKLSANVASSLTDEFKSLDSFERSNDENDVYENSIRVNQISALV